MELSQSDRSNEEKDDDSFIGMKREPKFLKDMKNRYYLTFCFYLLWE